MISATIQSQNAQVVIRSVQTLPERVLQAVEIGLARGLLALVGVIQKEWIQDGARVNGELGPGARLHSVTGRLRSGMWSTAKRRGAAVIGQVGNAVKYAAFHEFGFHGVENVRAHTRVIGQMNSAGNAIDTRRAIRSNTGEFLGYKESRKASSKFQRSGFSTVQYVQAHQRRVNYAGKPFVRPALIQQTPMILGEIRKELASIQN